MFVDFKFSTIKTQVGAYLNLMQNSVFQFSVADFILLNLVYLNMFCCCEIDISYGRYIIPRQLIFEIL